MDFSSLGRLLFASVFILSAWQQFNEFGIDGGPAAKSLGPKYRVFSKHVSSQTGLQAPSFEMKYAVAAAIAMKGVGGLLFIFGGSLGAYLLLLHQAIVTPIMYDFYNYDPSKKEFSQLFAEFAQNLALFGALIFFIGMNKNNAISRREHKKRGPKSKTV